MTTYRIRIEIKSVTGSSRFGWYKDGATEAEWLTLDEPEAKVFFTLASAERVQKEHLQDIFAVIEELGVQ